ncbi:Uu.00g012570.m01.CDS01 [Anthostomella pinea]|uniref:Uu.00g012570.m01.CDS01 n=1 Tax=Anthostomella pinea TaxID=933095 RepID=A0AAI8VZ76_9PEZI|nr:Uu.00g012570.m01.CDS01 [Anthostomella pinea]
MPLNILIVGAGVCGPALAMLLQSSDPSYNITVVERSASLRTAGQQIDLKSQGIEVLKKMGLFDTIKAHCVEETGLEILDPKAKPIAFFGVSPSGERRMALTSEYEIMRGDVVMELYEASLRQNAKLNGKLAYEFGKTIEELAQDGDEVDVTFSDGGKCRYDLVVAADGQASRTRRLAFGQDASDAAFKSLGIHAAYFSIPRIEGEGGNAKTYSAPGSRMMFTRTSNRPVTQVLLFIMKDVEELSKSYKQPVEKQKEAFAEAFRDAGWQSDRFLSEMKTCDDFYAHEVGQIKMGRLYNGCVVLLGDAGYCPSPFTGMGATGCLVGAYVLAGALATHKNDIVGALKAYEDVARPPVEEFQTLRGPPLGALFPSSQLGIWVLRNAMWAVSKLEQMTHRSPAQNAQGWKLPEYAELNLQA